MRSLVDDRQVVLRAISTIETHELNGSTLRLFLTTQLEAKQMNETKNTVAGNLRRTACIA